MTTVTQVGAGVAAANSAFTLPFTPVAGRSLIILVNHETALNGINGFSNNNTAQTWVDDNDGGSRIATDPNGLGRSIYRCAVLTGTMPTTVTCASSTAGTIHYLIAEVTDLHASPFVGVQYKNEASNRTSHSETFASSNANDMAMVLVTGNSDLGTITPNTGFTEIPTSRNARAGFYKADLGTAGSQTLAYTSSGSSTSNHLIAVYKSAVSDPTVLSVTGTTVTEGGSNVYTVTLSGATNRTTNYAASIPGGTATGADYDNDLGNATYSNGVTFSGGNMVVPTAVSSFTVGIATASDSLDEVDETYTLTVSGVSGTGTITDDDAPPTISVTDASENAMQVVFTVSLSQASGKSITVDYATANGTKTAGTDYTAASGTLTFAEGETTKTVTVAVL